MATVYLSEFAFARSGDKGDVSNIGIMAKTEAIYEFLKKELTPQRIKDHFKGMVKGDVEVYPLPNLNSLEIVLRQALGGGATCTLRFDQTGKSMGQALLHMPLEADDALIQQARQASAEILEKYGAWHR